MEPSVLELILDAKSEPTNIHLALLENITLNFAEERVIGKGKFSTVYKGVLPNREVAVKRLMNAHEIDEGSFYRAIDSMWNINHKNVVRFLGYCDNTEKIAIQIKGSSNRVYVESRVRILCFEHTSNGSLDNHITDELRGLEWNTRFQIIKQICEGLHHLHEQKHITHENLKPSNVLLDKHMVPKITDFSLSRRDKTNINTIVDPCFVYRAPESVKDCERSLSFESNIYSLGVLIIQIVTGSSAQPRTNDVLRRWRHRWRNSGLAETPLHYKQITQCIDLGLWCRQRKASHRPCIRNLVQIINRLDLTEGEISNVHELETTYGELENMLGIEPLELHFPFELNKQISTTVELTNQTDASIAFKIRNTSPLKYCIEPKKGMVPPQSMYIVKITLQAQEKAPQYMQQAYAFKVQSTKLNYAEDVTDSGDGNFDEVHLDVVLDAQLQSEIDIHKLKLQFPSEPNSLTSTVFKFDVLKVITGDFSTTSELGRGGYGVVYKGCFPSGDIIAVKKLAAHLVEEQRFQNEVTYHSMSKHQNVVKSVGYCAESSWELMPQESGRPAWVEIPNRLICLEYVCNKSLQNYIFDESMGLEWNMRYNIIKGICSGLHFLHEKCQIIHLDLKPDNILMDAAMVPKITDFGSSRKFDNKETEFITEERPGTRGYMAPEYTLDGVITTKADIFGVGVIIIQIVTGQKKYPDSKEYLELFKGNGCPQSTDTSFQKFTQSVIERWVKKFQSMPKYKSSVEKYSQQVQQCITIALRCVDIDREKRPTTKDIIQGLTTADQEGLSPMPPSDSSAGHQN